VPSLIEVPEEGLTFKQVGELIDQHYKDNPHHGVGCSCLDSILRVVRADTTFARINERIEQSPEGEHKRKVQEAIDYVMHVGSRRYY
jgi:hypothetical protein